jgi:copper chaperone
MVILQSNSNNMKTLRFKSNIRCMGCVAQVSPALNNAEGIDKWNVDIHNPQKILTVETDSLNATEVAHLVEKAGFRAEEI